MKKYFLFFILPICLFFNPKSVMAASTITAIPPRLIIEGNPGETITSELKVRNDSEISQVYTVAVDDFIVLDQIGTPIPVSTSVSSRWSLKSWILAPQTLPVDAKSTQVVRISIRIPQNALAGGHYAMITYMPNGDTKPNELKKTASIIGQRVGSLIYVTVKGKITENANLIKFSIPKFLEHGPVNISGAVENLSDIHINPTGTLSLFNPLNTKIKEFPVQVGNIFPETSREFSALWNQKWGWGRYRAQIDLGYGTSGQVISGTVFFWLFPIRLVIIILIAITSLLSAIILLNRRNKRRQEKLEQEVRQLKADLERVENKQS